MSKLFRGGIPTEPDVNLLREALPSIKPGDEITHGEIRRILGYTTPGKPTATLMMDGLRTGEAVGAEGRETKERQQAGRYRSITKAWRRWLFTNQNIELAAISGVGFRCLKAEERVTYNINSFKFGTRKQVRSLRHASPIPRNDSADALSAAASTKLDHLLLYGPRIVSAAADMMKEIRAVNPPPKQQELLPRPRFDDGLS